MKRSPLNTWSPGFVPPALDAEIRRRSAFIVPKAVPLASRKRIVPSVPFPPSAATVPGRVLRAIYDAGGQSDRVGAPLRVEGQASVGDSDVDRAYDNCGVVLDFYRRVHGWTWQDGGVLVSVVRVGGDMRAGWDGKQMNYGIPDHKIYADFLGIDVAGHEFTHFLTELLADLDYWGQTAATNEHISDVFGKLIEMWQRGLKVDSPQFDWLIGKGMFMPDIGARGLRDMLNPGTAYNNFRIGMDDQVGNYKDYVRTLDDSGGAHRNNGIPNSAFARFAIAVGGYPWDVGGHVWFEARSRAGHRPCFGSFAFHTLEACAALGFTAHQDKLLAAWRAVGVEPSATAYDDKTPQF